MAKSFGNDAKMPLSIITSVPLQINARSIPALVGLFQKAASCLGNVGSRRRSADEGWPPGMKTASNFVRSNDEAFTNSTL